MFEKAAQSFLDILLPRHCLLCLQASGPVNLCTPCRADLPQVCSNRGLQLGDYLRAYSALDYVTPVDYLVCQFKFNRNLACGEALADALTVLAHDSRVPKPQAFIAVPLHSTRFLARSFNQATVIASHLQRKLNIPLIERVLWRRRRTRAQSGLNAQQRRSNLSGAFELRNAARLSGIQHVALVDDVVTSGETLRECASVLRIAGIPQITAWTVARAQQPAAQSGFQDSR